MSHTRSRVSSRRAQSLRRRGGSTRKVRRQTPRRQRRGGLRRGAITRRRRGVGGSGRLTPIESRIEGLGLQGEIQDIIAGFGNAFGETIGPTQAFDIYNFDQQQQALAGFDFGGFGGQGGGGFEERPEPVPPPERNVTFSDSGISIGGAPEWWKALTPSEYDPISEYQTFTNFLIPFLSPEDQRTAATNLFASEPDAFADYNPELLGLVQAPGEITSDLRQQFFSGERATKALSALDKLLASSGKEASDFGPGYNFLRSIADTMADFQLTSGASQLTETQRERMLSAIDPLLARTKSKELAAFGPIAKAFVNPFFSAGDLQGNVRNRFGQLIQPPNPGFT